MNLNLKLLICAMAVTARGAEPVAYFDMVGTNAAAQLRTSQFVAIVGEVFASGPAGKAGLKVGDRIVGVNGKRVRSESE
ncbi:MAG: PDZ domain-containing protein, partial [Kiritimatiellaeota bacterium]|nr:PDZ domain-containing protein [Kiritimatiellota bacterium]